MGNTLNLELINAPSVWREGIYGDDVVVAIMDTGVDINHPALADSYRGYLDGQAMRQAGMTQQQITQQKIKALLI